MQYKTLNKEIFADPTVQNNVQWPNYTHATLKHKRQFSPKFMSEIYVYLLLMYMVHQTKRKGENSKKPAHTQMFYSKLNYSWFRTYTRLY
jgi:hypothetical protein